MNRKKHHAFSLPLCKLGVVNHLNQKIGYHGVGVLKKLSNKYFDKLIRDIRSKYNTELVNTSKTIPYIARNQNRDSFHLWSPAINPKGKSDFHWNSFMGIEVPVHTGLKCWQKDMT
jgi:KDO2-lipid IV(A) lauroyltransferase